MLTAVDLRCWLVCDLCCDPPPPPPPLRRSNKVLTAVDLRCWLVCDLCCDPPPPPPPPLRRSNKVLTAVDLRCWLVIYLNRNENVARQLVQALMQAAQGIGMNAVQPQMISLPNERTETFVEALRRAISPQLQLAVSVMPSQRDDRYAAIKRLCYVEMPVASQVRPIIVIALRNLGAKRHPSINILTLFP